MVVGLVDFSDWSELARKASNTVMSKLHEENSCSEGSRGEARPSLGGIDVNRLLLKVDCEEEAGISSPNSTISSVSGIGDEEDNETSIKKLKLCKDQFAILEESFKEHSALNPQDLVLQKQKLSLAKQLGLRP
ncbi:hypothetical protein K1719_008686 [Acacia pycnantha]|nr:hypothetical protein K1719_008686 [Acacia pycnantha]